MSRRRPPPYDPDRKPWAKVGYIYGIRVRGWRARRDVYVGRTTYSVEYRWKQHKRMWPRGLRAVYESGHELYLIVIEEVKNPTTRRLRARERYHYDRLKPRFNTCRPG